MPRKAVVTCCAFGIGACAVQMLRRLSFSSRFKQEGRDLIIVDTSGRHKQSGALFEEMRQVPSQQCLALNHVSNLVACMLFGVHNTQ